MLWARATRALVVVGIVVAIVAGIAALRVSYQRPEERAVTLPAPVAEQLCSLELLAAPERAAPGYFIEAIDLINSRPLMGKRTIRINPEHPSTGPGEVDLYLLCLGRRPGFAVAQFASNCSYLGDGATIICDAGLVERFLGGDAYEASRRAHIVQSNSLALSSWIVAHELGHLVNGDGKTHFALGRAAPATTAKMELQQRIELRADEFAARLLLNSKIWDPLMGFLNYDLMYAELRKEASTDAFAASVGAPLLTEHVRLLSCGTHPHYVFRAFSISSYDKRPGISAPLSELKTAVDSGPCRADP